MTYPQEHIQKGHFIASGRLFVVVGNALIFRYSGKRIIRFIPSASRESQVDLADIQNFGKDAVWRVVRADVNDCREWLAGASHCPSLSRHHIAHAGILSTAGELTIRRENQSGSFILVTQAGTGEVLIDGSWQEVGVDQAILLPPFMPNQLRSQADTAWSFCWIRFNDELTRRPMVHALSPSTCRFPHQPFRLAVEGLIEEAERVAAGDGGDAGLGLWTELLQHYALTISNPAQSDERLQRLWRAVIADLAYGWNQAEMAAVACMSREHLRRLCKRELGRSPNQHLIFLRMRRARDLLASTNDTIEVVAHAVGYDSPFTFSNTFQQWMGQRPSDMRK